MEGLIYEIMAGNVTPLIPLIASHILVRPLDGKGLFGMPALTDIEPLDLTFSVNRLRDGKWWTVLTHMFVHGSETHLQQNLASIIFMSAYPLQRVGALATYAVFIGGGVTAALDPFNFSDMQIELYFTNSWKVPKFGDGAVSDWINKKSNQLAKVTAVPFYQRYQNYCGSSAGATALMGFDAGLAAEDLYTMLRGSSNNNDGEEGFEFNNGSRDNGMYGPANSVIRCGNAVLVLHSAISMGLQDWHKATEGASWGIDHGGHVTGLLFGAGCFLGWRGFQYLRARARRPRFRDPEGGGRRLGGR